MNSSDSPSRAADAASLIAEPRTSLTDRRGDSPAELPNVGLDWTIIEAGKGGKQYLRDLWRFRELLYFLAWRDILVRYKQTSIGILWSVIRPLATMLVLTFVFSRVMHIASTSAPYPLFIFAALLPWNFFATTLQDSSNSLVNNAHMISKVYFPRLVIPAAAVVVNCVDFAISLGILFALMLYYRAAFSIHMFALIPYFLLAALGSLAAGAWFAALNVKFRDVRQIVPIITLFGMYLSPVLYSSGMVPARFQYLYFFNPMATVIDGFRWSILGGPAVPLQHLLAALLVSIVVAILGTQYFLRTERLFADLI